MSWWDRLRPEERRSIDWRGVPRTLRMRATAVVRNPWQAEDLVKFYGSHDYTPAGGVVLIIPGQPPVYIEAHGQRTAAQLRDIAAETWHRIINEIRDDPDEGRFDAKDFLYMPREEQFKKLNQNRLAHILRDANNAILHPEREPHQQRRIEVVRP